MDPRLLHYYNLELQHLREIGGEFAQQFPKIAARLGMSGLEVADPYVERLLEGAGFMAARVQLKMDAEFPRFTQSLLEIIYPHYLAPTPAMAIVQFLPTMTEGALASGFVIPRGTLLRGQIPRGEVTACQFRTAHDVTLWPIEIADVRYSTLAPENSTTFFHFSVSDTTILPKYSGVQPIGTPPSSSNPTSSPVTVLITSGPVMNMVEVWSTITVKSVSAVE